jgi:hypothetical protein
VSPDQPIVGIENLASDVADLAWAWARRELGLGPDDPPVNAWVDLPPEQTRRVRLTLLGVLEQMRAAVDDHAGMTARAAAKAGADYSDLGDAVGMTRQGARRRWPDLAEIAKAARRACTAREATAGPPTFRFELYVPNAAAGAIVGHLVAAGHTGREAVQGAAGVHIGLPDRVGAEALRKRLAAAGYQPGDVIEP